MSEVLRPLALRDLLAVGTLIVLWAVVPSATTPADGEWQGLPAEVEALPRGSEVLLRVTNTRDVPLDSWEVALVVHTGSPSRPRTISLRHDFYKSAAFDTPLGEGPIKPYETREETISVPGLVNTGQPRLRMLLYRDGRPFGNVRSAEEVVARRGKEAVVIKYWLDLLQDLSVDDLAESRSIVAAWIAGGTPRTTAEESPETAKDIEQSLKSLLSLPLERFGMFHAHLVARLSRQYEAARQPIRRDASGVAP